MQTGQAALTGANLKAAAYEDFIITPMGVIKTDPGDYIIGTKTPGELGGKKEVNINIKIDKPTVSKMQDINELVKAIEMKLYPTLRRYNSYAF
jgi:cobalamin biosynthesis Co2+ chelatase CbiK